MAASGARVLRCHELWALWEGQQRAMEECRELRVSLCWLHQGCVAVRTLIAVHWTQHPCQGCMGLSSCAWRRTTGGLQHASVMAAFCAWSDCAHRPVVHAQEQRSEVLWRALERAIPDVRDRVKLKLVRPSGAFSHRSRLTCAQAWWQTGIAQHAICDTDSACAFMGALVLEETSSSLSSMA